MTVTEDPATTATAPEKEVGKARKRKEDARLITGRTTWTDNMVLPGMLHMSVVRSPVAHGKITNVDVSAAQQAPGVVAVFTGRDLAEEQGSIPCAWPVTPDMVNPGHPSIAVEEVNHVGEAVAVIIARSRSAAADAIELVDVDYDLLPPVLDMEEAVKHEADLCHDHTESNTSYHFVFDAGEAGTGTDTEQAFADADVVVSRRFVNQRLIPAFMEPRSVVVQPQGENFTLWSATQIPHILRVMLASVTGVPEHKLRVIAPDVGGGFGGKLQVNPEEILALLIARRLGKPIKWTETRSESLMTAHHGRDQIQYVDVAADREGNVKGLRVRILADMGSYLRLITPGVPALGAFMFPGIYKFPAYRFECDGIFTNKVPT
ncbi:MAG TPA: molybdopterin cofactor-binding domain-containing protein, partial [Geodermatophilus sp.]|nr:molybdopterin cofactor-binding domain-containing protein [Geodermatophilus sp.]